MSEVVLSPRGIPPIRTDWLADVAWRAAAVGPEVLGQLGDEDSITLTDHVDGAAWRIDAFRVSDSVVSWVELDGDLYLPTDEDTATLRVAIALVPSWDAAAGEKVTEARIEVGPRGAVTFDPENWMLRIPDPVGDRPAIDGVLPGRWEGLPTPANAPLELSALAGRRVGFGELVEIAEGGSTWIASLPVYGAPVKQGFLGRLRGESPLGDPEAVIVIEAAGPLSVDPEELLAGEDFPEVGVIDAIEPGSGTVRFTGAQLDAAGGWIAVHGASVRVSAFRR